MTEHREAYALMQYSTDDGTESEIIWNSRDGVTPFCIHSRTGKEMRHVNWHEDRRVRNHVPKVGDRIFVDLTLEKAKEYRREFVDEWWDDGEYPMNKRWATKEQAIEDLSKSDMNSFAPHTPDLVTVDEEMRESFLNRSWPTGKEQGLEKVYGDSTFNPAVQALADRIDKEILEEYGEET